MRAATDEGPAITGTANISDQSGARGGTAPRTPTERALLSLLQKGSLVARLSAGSSPQPQVEDGYLIALAKQGHREAYDHIVRRYYGFVRLKASSYFLAGGDSDDLIQEGLV